MTEPASAAGTPAVGSDTNRSVNRRRWLRGLLWGTPTAALADGFAIEPGWLAVRRKRLADDPALRLVHFSDLHHKGDEALLAETVRIINSLKPDVVCFTGDLVEDAKHAPAALAGLAGIKAPLFGVPGNHDYWAKLDFAAANRAFAQTGGAWLMNESRRIPGLNLRITGMTCETPLPPASVDLALAGHSHGGQVRLPLLGPPMVPGRVGRYSLGQYETAAGPLHVTAGIGYFLLNLRFNCRPEIVLFEI